jgi:hypothetical protein
MEILFVEQHTSLLRANLEQFVILSARVTAKEARESRTEFPPIVALTMASFNPTTAWKVTFFSFWLTGEMIHRPSS